MSASTVVCEDTLTDLQGHLLSLAAGDLEEQYVTALIVTLGNVLEDAELPIFGTNFPGLLLIGESRPHRWLRDVSRWPTTRSCAGVSIAASIAACNPALGQDYLMTTMLRDHHAT